MTTAALIEAGVLEIGDGYRAKNSELAADGVPFARAGNIRGGFDFDGADRVPAETLSKVGAKRSQVGDVVFTSKGTVGRFAWVTSDTEPFVFSPQLCFWRSRDPERLHPRYLYYWMQGSECLRQIEVLKGQTDMADYVSLRDQRAMQITLPGIEDQRAAASVLGALDDKIESNARAADSLWRVAAAHFEQAFGRDWAARHSAGRAAPEGTRWGLLSDLAELRYGKALRADERVGGRASVVGSSGVVGSHNKALVAGPAIVVGRKGTAGSVTWIHNDAWPIDTTFFVVPSGASLPYLFFGLLAADLPSLTADSAVPGLNRDAAYARPVLVPERGADVRFSAAVDPLLRLAAGLDAERERLTEVRDSLLPGLVSGRIRPESHVGRA